MKMFISSTYEDLISHREAAARAIERLGQQGIRMEVFGSRPSGAVAACFEEIAGSDALVGIYAHRYGYVPGGQLLSITEQEFLYAQELGKPTFCFVVDEEYPWPPIYVESEPGRTDLRGFLQRLREAVVVDTFTSPDDLAFKVASSLGRFLLYQKVKEELERLPATNAVSTELGRSQVARRAARIPAITRGAEVLLVNDVPADMRQVIEILRTLGVHVQVETSSEAALSALVSRPFNAVVSDMQRGTTEDEGARFLGKMWEANIKVPVIFTVGRFDPALGTPPFAFGITNRVDELLNLLFDVLERARG